MKNLNDLTISDVKSSLDFVRELKADSIKDAEQIENSSTLRMLSELEEKLRSHLFFRVMLLRKAEVLKND